MLSFIKTNSTILFVFIICFMINVFNLITLSFTSILGSFISAAIIALILKLVLLLIKKHI